MKLSQFKFKLPDEKIALMRTVQETPDLFTKAEFDELGKKHWIHESGDFNNFCPDYKMVLEAGFYGLKDEIKKQVLCCREEKEKLDFLKARLYHAEAEECARKLICRRTAPGVTVIEFVSLCRFIPPLLYPDHVEMPKPAADYVHSILFEKAVFIKRFK